MTNKEALKYAKRELEASRLKVADGRQHYQIMVEYYEAIVEALEKQIPKKPRTEIMDFNGEAEYDACPVCGESDITVDMDYCPTCGQALDWSDEE